MLVYCRIDKNATPSGTYEDKAEACKRPLDGNKGNKKHADWGIAYCYLFAQWHDIYKLVNKLLPEAHQQERGLSGGKGHSGRPASARTSDTGTEKSKKRYAPDDEPEELDGDDDGPPAAQGFFGLAGETLQAIKSSFNPSAPSSAASGSTHGADNRVAEQEIKLKKWKAKHDVADKQREFMLKVSSSNEASAKMKEAAEEKILNLFNAGDFGAPPSPLSD